MLSIGAFPRLRKQDVGMFPRLRKQDVGMFPRLSVLIVSAFPPSLHLGLQSAQPKVDRSDKA